MIRSGEKFELEFSYSQEEVDRFSDITKDNNPIHINSEYAAKTVFKKPIIHGFLGGAVFSRIFGTMFPGEGTIYLQQNLTFKRPMFVGTTYKALVDVVEVDTAKHRAIIQTSIIDNASGKQVISGEAVVQNDQKI